MTSVGAPSRPVAPGEPAAEAQTGPEAFGPARFSNRELSWLEFNARVLAEAADSRVPLYERAKFLAIFASNLDEFFMVRVAGLQAQQSGEIEEATADGMTPQRQLTAIAARSGR